MQKEDKYIKINIREYLELGADNDAGEPALVDLLSDFSCQTNGIKGSRTARGDSVVKTSLIWKEHGQRRWNIDSVSNGLGQGNLIMDTDCAAA